MLLSFFLFSTLFPSFFPPWIAQGVLQYPMTLSEPPLVFNLLALLVQKCKNTDAAAHTGALYYRISSSRQLWRGGTRIRASADACLGLLRAHRHIRGGATVYKLICVSWYCCHVSTSSGLPPSHRHTGGGATVYIYVCHAATAIYLYLAHPLTHASSADACLGLLRAHRHIWGRHYYICDVPYY